MHFRQNPFFVLKATVRDSREKLHELAESHSLDNDAEQYTKALSSLTHPKRRIAAEIAWAPAISPARLDAILSTLFTNAGSMAALMDLPSLARANLLAAELSERTVLSPDELESALTELVTTVADINVESTIREINVDRTVSGFNKLVDSSQISEELKEQYRHFEQVSKTILGQFSISKQAHLLTRLTESLTAEGTVQPPQLLEQLVSSYELSVTKELTQQAESIGRAVEAILKLAELGTSENDLLHNVTQLVSSVHEWDALAQPIQVANRSRGLDHQASDDLAYVVREGAISLWNDHHMQEAAKVITRCLATAFAESPQLSSKFAQDQAIFADIEQKRRENRKAQEKQRLKGLSFSSTGQMGVLKISPAGVQYGNTLIPIPDIARIRIVNRPNLGVALTANGKVHYVYIPNTRTFNAFLKRLIPAIAPQIIEAFLEEFKKGKTFVFGPIVVSDTGVKISRQRMFRGPESLDFSWSEVQRSRVDGAMVIRALRDSRFAARVSFSEVDNALMLDILLDQREDTRSGKLSDLL